MEVVFIVLSFLDWFLTWQLLENSHGGIYEANPIASVILLRFDWLGIGVFKLGCTLTGLVTILVLCQLRPHVGLRLCTVMSLCLVAVIGYSIVLWVAQPWQSEDLCALAQAKQNAARLEQHRLAYMAYMKTRNQLAHDLAAERHTLSQATDELARRVAEMSHEFLFYVPSRPTGPDLEAFLAEELISAARVEPLFRYRPGLAARRTNQLAREFELQFHTALPQYILEIQPSREFKLDRRGVRTAGCH
jgi:hypothetical protein